jgi:hypothetical protein
MRQEFVLNPLHQGFELSIESIVEKNDPSHGQIMDLKTYVVNSIWVISNMTFTFHLKASGLR